MNSYLNAILTVSVICGVVNSFLPTSNESIKKYVNYVIGLVMVIVLLSPLSSLVEGISSLKESISDFADNLTIEEKIDNSNEIIINAGEKSVCDGIKKIIISKYGFDETDVYVSLEINKSDIQSITINQINVILTNKASWSDAGSVEKYLKNMIGCDIEVVKK